jgi:hypothetical protein
LDEDVMFVEGIREIEGSLKEIVEREMKGK